MWNTKPQGLGLKQCKQCTVVADVRVATDVVALLLSQCFCHSPHEHWEGALESLRSVNQGLVAMTHEFSSITGDSHGGTFSRLDRAAARIQGLIQGHRDGLVVEQLLYDSEIASASALQGIVRGKVGRRIAQAQLTIEQGAVHQDAQLLIAPHPTEPLILLREVATKAEVEEFWPDLEEESDEECAYAPGSPTGKQGTDLMAAKRAKQAKTPAGPIPLSSSTPFGPNVEASGNGEVERLRKQAEKDKRELEAQLLNARRTMETAQEDKDALAREADLLRREVDLLRRLREREIAVAKKLEHSRVSDNVIEEGIVMLDRAEGKEASLFVDEQEKRAKLLELRVLEMESQLAKEENAYAKRFKERAQADIEASEKVQVELEALATSSYVQQHRKNAALLNGEGSSEKGGGGEAEGETREHHHHSVVDVNEGRTPQSSDETTINRPLVAPEASPAATETVQEQRTEVRHNGSIVRGQNSSSKEAGEEGHRVNQEALGLAERRTVLEAMGMLAGVQQLFAACSRDNYLEIGSFRELTGQLGWNLSSGELQNAFEAADRDAKGKISYEEYERWWLLLGTDVLGFGERSRPMSSSEDEFRRHHSSRVIQGLVRGKDDRRLVAAMSSCREEAVDDNWKATEPAATGRMEEHFDVEADAPGTEPFSSVVYHEGENSKATLYSHPGYAVTALDGEKTKFKNMLDGETVAETSASPYIDDDALVNSPQHNSRSATSETGLVVPPLDEGDTSSMSCDPCDSAERENPTSADAVPDTLRHYHDGECGPWCRAPPWPLRPCRPATEGSPPRVSEATAVMSMNNQEEIKTLFEVCRGDSSGTVNLDEFLEYLTFISPQTQDVLGKGKDILQDISPETKDSEMDFDVFELWFVRIAPMLPPGTVDTLLHSDSEN